MPNRFTRIISLASVLFAAVVVSTPSQAMPAFARQTGKACNACHFQHYPALNDYGMEFKAGGYTDMKQAGEVKGKDLSLPGIMNASLFSKIRYVKDNGKDGTNVAGEAAKTTHSGELQFPDEFALLIGGRVTDSIGFMVESQFAGAGLNGGGANFLAGFKLPTTFKLGTGMKAGITPFMTDGLGASYGFEQLSTGAVRNIRANENRAETSAMQYVFFSGTGPVDAAATDPFAAAPAVRLNAGAASGVALSLWDPSFNAAYTAWTPTHVVQAGSNVGGLGSGLLRAVWTPTLGDWNMGVGIQSYTGNNVRLIMPDGTLTNVNTKGTAFDVQAHGAWGNMPLGIYFTHANAPGQAAADTVKNLFNNNVNARKATVITAELGVIPAKATVTLSYRSANTGTTTVADGGKDDSWLVGGTYQLAQNVQLQLNHSVRSKRADGVGRYGVTNYVAGGTTRGDSQTLLMLSAGF